MRGHRPFMSSMWGDTSEWIGAVDSADERHIRGLPKDHWRLWRLSRGKHAVILLGSVTLRHLYRDLLFALLVKLGRKPRPRVVITDATWEPRSRTLEKKFPWVAPILPCLIRGWIRLIDGPNVRYCVLSTHELTLFSETWGVDPQRVFFTPFYATIPMNIKAVQGDYLFAGGESLRDYGLFAQALSGTSIPAKVRTRWQPDPEDLGYAEWGRVPEDQFLEELAQSRVVVVTIQPSMRSAGQQTYLNAMLMGKVVIVTEAPGVRDYIEDGVTGIVVPADPAALRSAILHAMDPAHDDCYQAMRTAAREAVLDRFTLQHYHRRILEIAGE